MTSVSKLRVLLALGIALCTTAAGATDGPILRGTFGGPEVGAAASAGSGLYAGARGGLSWMRDTSFDSGSRTISSTLQYIDPYIDLTTGTLIGPFVIDQSQSIRSRVGQAYDQGYNFSGFVGYDFGPFMEGFGARMELEVGRFSNNVRSHMEGGTEQITTNVTSPIERVTVQTPPQTVSTLYTDGISGRTNVTYLLANYYVDWNLGWIRPFAGAGLGIAQVNMQNHSFAGLTMMNHSNWGWAYQFGGGLSFDLTPTIALEAGYRVLGVRDVSLATTTGVTDKVQVTTQQANVGIRVRF